MGAGAAVVGVPVGCVGVEIGVAVGSGIEVGAALFDPTSGADDSTIAPPHAAKITAMPVARAVNLIFVCVLLLRMMSPRS
jgi:hypothetical protein